MAKAELSPLLERADQTAQAIDAIDHDPEEALARLEPVIEASPNVGEITPSDMFRLMTQMQGQLMAQQNQILELMGQRKKDDRGPDMQEELRRDKQQRDATLEAWKVEPREPVWLQPTPDEEKIHAVTGMYPPRSFWVNGLEFPVNVGEIVGVPESIARVIEYTQHRRGTATRPPTALERITDPERAQFLAGSQAISLGHYGMTGQGPLPPAATPPNPQPLGYQYDHRGQ